MIVYLIDGTKAELVQDLGQGNGYIVNVYRLVEDFEGETHEILNSKNELVQDVFKSAPENVIDEKIAEKQKRLSEQTVKLKEIEKAIRSLRSEVVSLESQKTKFSELIINLKALKTAKKITLFPNEKVLPKTINGYSDIHSISMEIRPGDGNYKPRFWIKKGDYSEYVDQDADILIDATDEEIENYTKQRVATKPNGYFRDYYLTGVDDKYLTEELIELRNKKAITERKAIVEKLKATIESSQKQLDSMLSDHPI